MQKNKGVDYPYIKGRPETVTVEIYRPSLDSLDDMLFDHEKEALQEAKGWEVAEHFPDHFIMSCIFSRKFDMKRVRHMMEQCFAWREAEGYVDWPTYDSIEKDFLFNGSWYQVPGARAKDGCGILYMKVKNMITKDQVEFDLAEYFMRVMMWNNSVGMFVDGIDIHRNGFYWICDMKGYGWKHVDLDMQKKMSKIRDHFPMRLKTMFLLNPPKVMKAIMLVLKPFMQKKVRKRMKNISSLEDLLEHFDEDQIVTEFGGTVVYDADQHQEAIEEYLAHHGLQ
jgi:hypothetical protein